MTSFTKPSFIIFFTFSISAILIGWFCNQHLLSLIYQSLKEIFIIILILLIIIIIAYKTNKTYLSSFFIWITIFILIFSYCIIHAQFDKYTTLQNFNDKNTNKENFWLAFEGYIKTTPILKKSSKGFLNHVFDLNCINAYYYDNKSNTYFKKYKVNTIIKVYIKDKYFNNMKLKIYRGDYVAVQGKFEFTENIIKNKTLSDYGIYLKDNNISGTLIINNPNDINILEKNDNVLSNYLYDIKLKADSILENYFSNNSLAIIKGIIFGDTGLITKDLRYNFNVTGTAHILAVSGLHIGFIVSIFLLILYLLPIRKKWIYIIVLIPLFIYWGIVGEKISVSRAIIMYICLFVLSKHLNRSGDTLNNLFISGIIIYIIDPKSIFNISFQMSFAAVAGIILLYPILYNLILFAVSKIKIFSQLMILHNIKNKIVKYIIGLIIVSFVAEISLHPIIAYHFHQIPLTGIIANLIVIPLCFLIVCLTFIFFISYTINNGIADFISYLIDNLIDFMLVYIQKISSLGFTIKISENIFLAFTIIYLCMLLIIFVFLNRLKNKYINKIDMKFI